MSILTRKSTCHNDMETTKQKLSNESKIINADNHAFISMSSVLYNKQFKLCNKATPLFPLRRHSHLITHIDTLFHVQSELYE